MERCGRSPWLTHLRGYHPPGSKGFCRKASADAESSTRAVSGQFLTPPPPHLPSASQAQASHRPNLYSACRACWEVPCLLSYILWYQIDSSPWTMFSKPPSLRTAATAVSRLTTRPPGLQPAERPTACLARKASIYSPAL